MIPGAGAGKGDSPRAVNGDAYRDNFSNIDWSKGRPKDRPWLIVSGAFRADPYAGLDVHQRILKTYYDRECSGELRPDKMHKKFRDAHINAQQPGYWNR